MRAQRIMERRQKHRSILLRLLLFCTMFGAAAVFIIYGCRLNHIEISGSTYYTEEELMDYLLRDELDHNTIYFYLSKKYGEKTSIPFIEQIEYSWAGLNTIKAEVYEKVVTGCIYYMGEYVCFDKDGIMVGSVTEQKEGIPCITGLSYDAMVYNEPIRVDKPELFQIIMNLTQLIQKNALPIDTVNFNAQYEVTLFHENIRVLLGKRDTYDEQLSALKDILKKSEGMSGVMDMKEFSSDKTTVRLVSDE